MDTVPLDLQRRCEQRWAARYQRPLEPAATPEHRLQKQDQWPAPNGQDPPFDSDASVTLRSK